MKKVLTLILMSLFMITTAFSQDLINEDFEGVTPPDLPMGWTGIIDSGGGDMLYTYNDGSTTMAVFFRQSGSTTIPFIMISPQVELSNAGMLNFDLKFGANFIEDLVLSVGTISDPLNGDTYSEMTQIPILSSWTNWENVSVDFSSYSGADEYVAFKFLGEDAGVFFYLDNVVLNEGGGGAFDNDMALAQIISPVSGVDLTSTEPVTIKIKNMGLNPQSNFDVSYTIDGGTQVTETVTATINSLESYDYTFNATADLSAYGTYSIEACTALTGDENPDNDCLTVDVENSEPALCLEGLYSTGCNYGDGLTSWELSDVNVLIGCDGPLYTWYHDYTDMVHSFEAGMDYTLTVQTGYANTYLDVWIDFNDDLFMDDSEHILDDSLCASAGYYYQFPITIPADAPAGQHILRYRTNYNAIVDGSCDTYNYGNMCDFTADISGGGTTPDCENFDNLTVGGLVADQLGGMWTTWSGTNADDATVSDTYSNSPSNSFIVDAGTVDLVYQFGTDPLTTGQWNYSNYIYVPAGYSGYFNVQSEPTPGVAWVIELFFDDGGTGRFIIDGVQTNFTYSQDNWFNLSINFDLDNDLAEIKIDGTLVLLFETTNSIGGIDYYGANSGGEPGAFYDDVCFVDGYEILTPPPPENLTATVIYPDVLLNWDAPFANTVNQNRPETTITQDSISLLGYNIYRLGFSGNFEFIAYTTDTSYTDTDGFVTWGICYKVTAVYTFNFESEYSNESCIATGTNEYYTRICNIFPNPATDVVNVKSDVQINSVKVYNYAGQVIVNEEVNSMMYQLNSSQYQSGIYFFQIETDEGTISKRVIIQ